MSTRPLPFVLGLVFATLALACDRAPTLAAGEVGPRVAAVLANPDPLERIEELSALLRSLDPDAIPEVLEAFSAAPLDGGDPELQVLGIWWARFDPAAAVSWTQTDRRAGFGAVIAAVFRGWAHADPRAAVDSAERLRFRVQRELALGAVVAGWDESGQPGLLEFIAGQESELMQRLAGTYARRRVAVLGPEGAFRWVQDPDSAPGLRDVMLPRIASAAAEVPGGGALAAEWATPFVRSDERLSNYPRRIGTRWVTTEPEATMTWLSSLPAGADRDDGVSETFREWMRRDHVSATAWIEENLDETWVEPATAVYARSFAFQRPQEAIELARKLSDEELRERTMLVIARKWVEQDPATAREWLAQPDLPERLRNVASLERRERKPRRGRRAGAAPEGPAEGTAF